MCQRGSRRTDFREIDIGEGEGEEGCTKIDVETPDLAKIGQKYRSMRI